MREIYKVDSIIKFVSKIQHRNFRTS